MRSATLRRAPKSGSEPSRSMRPCSSRSQTTAKGSRPSTAAASSRNSSASLAPRAKASASASISPARSSSPTAAPWESTRKWETAAASGSRSLSPAAPPTTPPPPSSGDTIRNSAVRNCVWCPRNSVSLVFLPLSPERRGIDAEQVRRFLLRLRPRQHAQDVLALHLLHGEISAELRHRRRGLRDPLRKRLRLQDL